MDDPRLPRLLCGFLLLGGLGMMAYYYPQMPQRMAAHFAADGYPNGWQPRDAYFLIMLAVCAASAIPAFVAPWQIARQPDQRIHLPNKNFWLAPERRQETFRYFAAIMSWFSCAILFVLLAGTFLAFRANLDPGHRFNSEAMLIVLGAFLLFLVSLIILLLSRFRQVPSAS